jgi:hypothetical protein
MHLWNPACFVPSQQARQYATFMWNPRTDTSRVGAPRAFANHPKIPARGFRVKRRIVKKPAEKRDTLSGHKMLCRNC